MTARILIGLGALVLAAACGSSGTGPATAPQPKPEPPSFIGRVWRVTESSVVAPGTYYVFLPDNTMLVTPPGAMEPEPGRWHFAGGGLVLIEAGYRYPTDILEAGAERFAVRMHRRGGVVDVKMVPAGLRNQ